MEINKFLSSFSSKKRKKVSQMPVFYLALLVGFAIALASFGYSFIIIYSYTDTEGANPALAINLFAGMTSVFIFMSAMKQARGIYVGDDYDLLVTLPIRKRDIVTSKLINMFLVDFIFSILIMVPHGVMMLLMVKDFSLFLICLLLAFSLPLVPIAIAIIISLLMTMLTARFKAANFAFSILYVIVIVGLSSLSFIANSLRNEQASNVFGNVGNIIKWTNPAYYFVEQSLVSDRLYILIYLAISLVSISLAILFVALLFDKLHDVVSSISMKKKYVRKDLKQTSEGKLLLSLEFKRLVNSRFYFANTIMGSIMGILGSTAYLFSMWQGARNANPNSDALVTLNAVFIPIFIGIACMIFGLVNPTTGCLNIEGNNFWLIKSLPIDKKKYLHSKLLFSFILTLPASIITSTIAVIFHHENIVEIMFTYLIPLLYIVLNALLGLIIATHYIKVKWNSESEAIKNAANVTISLFIDLGISTVVAALLIIFPIFFPTLSWVSYLVVTISLLIPIIPCYIYLNKYFGKRIDIFEDL